MRKMRKKGIAAVMALALTIGGITWTASNTTKVQAALSYQLVWSDEFNGTSLDVNTWNYEIGTGSWGWGNNEQQYYTDRTENISVHDGSLHINAIKESYRGSQYTSARINTKGKKDFKYGRIEARMKLPSFTGSWPAFWMLGANFDSIGWPRCGEIDIMEAINTENFTNGALHWYVNSDGYNGQGDTGDSANGKTPAGYNRTDFHTYGLEWDETTMKWYIDDTVFLTQDITADHMEEFHNNHFIIFNLAIGGQWPGYDIDASAFPDRSSVEVDYVRVYQLKEDTGNQPTTKQPETVTYVTEEQVDAVQERNQNFTTYQGPDWADGATIASANTSAQGAVINVSNIGNNIWGLQAHSEKLRVVGGNTYRLKTTLLSDINKSVRVKVRGNASDDNIFFDRTINLQAGVPYTIDEDVRIPAKFNGTVDIDYGYGLNTEVNEQLPGNTGFRLEILGTSLTTTERVVHSEVVTNQQQETTASAQTTADASGETYAGVPQIEKTKLGNTTVKKATKKKSAKKAKITLKKVAGADGYQVKISYKKKFAKKATMTKNIKKVKASISLKKKLRKKKKLFVKARAYQMVNGKKSYGTWSKRKKIKVKKRALRR